MSDITAFIDARLDEWEAGNREIHEARVCSGCHDGWEAGFDPDRCDCGYPARVLRDVAALRTIVKLHTGPHECSSYNDMIGDFDNCMWIDEFDVCSTMRHAAAIWAGHPDYDPGWAPQQQSGPGA